VVTCNLILFPFVGVENVFGKMTVVVNSSNFIAVNVFVDQFISVFNGSLFSGSYNS